MTQNFRNFENFEKSWSNININQLIKEIKRIFK